MKIQITAEVYKTALKTMKSTLDLIEFGMDMRTKRFFYAKSQVFDYFYNNLLKLFKSLEDQKLIKKCPQGHNLRQGFRQCLCCGSGYVNI